MKIQNLCSAKKYEKDGVEKTAWRKCGELKTWDNGKQAIEWFDKPDVYYGVFEQKKKEEESSNDPF